MKSALKFFYKSHRIGASTGKTLLWIWVRNDLPKLTGDLGIDLAGGTMGNKRFFKTKEYICVDINQSKLDIGIANNPDAKIINSRIQDFLLNENQKKPNLLVCLQTMGTNSYFEHDETLNVIKLMYRSLKEGGNMVFNIGKESGDLNIIEKEINIFFKKKFKSIQSKSYGALHKTYQKPIPGFARLGLAYIMHLLPPLRTLFGSKKDKLYYCCKGKL